MPLLLFLSCFGGFRMTVGGLVGGRRRGRKANRGREKADDPAAIVPRGLGRRFSTSHVVCDSRVVMRCWTGSR